MRKSIEVLKNAIEGLADYKSMTELKKNKDMFYHINLSTANVVIKELDLMMKCALVNKYKLSKDIIKYEEPLPRFIKRNNIVSLITFTKLEYKVQGAKPNPNYIFERAKTYLTYLNEFLCEFDNYKDEKLFSEIYDKQDKNLYIAHDESVPFMRPNWESLLKLWEER